MKKIKKQDLKGLFLLNRLLDIKTIPGPKHSNEKYKGNGILRRAKGWV